MSNKIAIFLLSFLLQLLATPGRANEDQPPTEEGHEHAGHHRFYAGVTASALWAFEADGTTLHGGGGFFFCGILIPHRLELELAAKVLAGGNGVVDVPVDLVLKVPFHVNHVYEPFIGLGPSLVPVSTPGQLTLHAGGVAVLGSHFWLSRDTAIVVEGGYNLLYAQADATSSGHLLQEIEASSSVLVAF